MLYVITIKACELILIHCAGTVQMREESESGIRKWEEMWFKTTAEDGEGGQQHQRQTAAAAAADVYWVVAKQAK